VSLHVSDELLSAELDGALSTEEATALSEHIGSCAACRQRQAMMHATARAVAGLPAVAAPPSLDLSFLPHAPSAPIVLAPRRWRPPTWAAPVLAAAALLLVAVTFGPTWLRAGGGATTAGTTAARPTGGANAQDRNGAAPASPEFGTAEAPAARLPGNLAATPGASHTFPDANGLTLSVGPAPSGTRSGQAVALAVQARAGQAVHLTELNLQVRHGSTTSVIARSTAAGLSSGEQADLSATWKAGQVGSSTAPGDYQLEGHAVLADGRDLFVSLTITVS
jgi:hypothetical protein